MDRRADEILILRRFPGYLRFHIPPLIYSAKAAHLIEKSLLAIEGVRRVMLKKEMGKVSVYFDAVMVPENQVFLKIDEVATPLLKRDQQESYEKVVAQIEDARRRRLIRKATVTVILAYLVKVHWRLVSRYWIRDPIRHWPKLASIGVLIYIHRKHIREAPNFD